MLALGGTQLVEAVVERGGCWLCAQCHPLLGRQGSAALFLCGLFKDISVVLGDVWSASRLPGVMILGWVAGRVEKAENPRLI